MVSVGVGRLFWPRLWEPGPLSVRIFVYGLRGESCVWRGTVSTGPSWEVSSGFFVSFVIEKDG